MRVLDINGAQARELPPCSAHTLPEPPAPGHFYWLSVTRAELRDALPPLQTWLQALTGVRLVDLHVSDLLNEQLPSHYDATSAYDVLVLRRLASAPLGETTSEAAPPTLRGGPPVLRRIDTRPVGFVVFERLLLTVHPENGSVRDAVAERLMTADAQPLDVRSVSSRLPAGPADLMLRVANQIVDGYLALRRELTRQLDHWQAELIDPKTRFTNWGALMQARQGLHHLDEICEDQQTAVQDWIDTLEALPLPDEAGARRDHELLLVRSRDVLEHIERVVRHVRRLEQNAELAVQLHFNVQSHRTNDIMRVLTVLTAVFLPLNLIAGIFGMNFEFIPLVHAADGFWVALVAMVLIAAALVVVFWRKRYLARTTH